MNSILREVCVNNVEEALQAQINGAERIELCSRLDLGGLSPSLDQIKQAKQQLSIPFTVMIRPNHKNFVYTESEFDQMKQEIIQIKEIQGIFGVVFGILDSNNEVDIARNKELIELAGKDLQVTFHRAFDEVKDPYKALEQIIDLGAKRILTSGQGKTAREGMEVLKKCIQQAQGRIIIMPGSGINRDNLEQFTQQLDTNEFHGSKIV